jgi:hypothetical protein
VRDDPFDPERAAVVRAGLQVQRKPLARTDGGSQSRRYLDSSPHGWIATPRDDDSRT